MMNGKYVDADNEVPKAETLEDKIIFNGNDSTFSVQSFNYELRGTEL